MISNRRADLLTMHKQRREADRIDQYPLDDLSEHPQIKSIIEETLKKFTDAMISIYEFSNSESDVTGSQSGSGFGDHTNGRGTARCVGDLSMFVYGGVRPDNEMISKQIDVAENEAYGNALKRFITKHRKELEQEGIDKSKVDYQSLYDSGHGSLAEALSEMESEYMYRDTFEFYMNIYYYNPENRNRSNEDSNLPEIRVAGGIDSYYSMGENVFSFSTLSELKNKLNDSVNQLIAALK